MRNLPANLIAEKNKLHSTEPWIILLEITLNDEGPTILRLCNNTEDFNFEGNNYTAFPFKLGWIGSNVEGEIPKVTLQISNVTRLLTPYLNDLDGGLASTVTVTLVNHGLPGEDYSELELDFTVMGCEVDENWIMWSLGMFNPMNQRFPLFRYIANYCPYTFYNDGTGECGYSGALTSCLHTLDACIAHGNEENFGGDLGMQNDGLRIV